MESKVLAAETKVWLRKKSFLPGKGCKRKEIEGEVERERDRVFRGNGGLA